MGYGWIDGLKDHAESKLTDIQLDHAPQQFTVNPPATKEGYLYRSIFDELFPLAAAAACVPGGKSVACSTPEALAWDRALSDVVDPSGRAVRGVHEHGY